MAPALAEWGLQVSPSALSKLDAFSVMLVERNKTQNLTAITDPSGIARRHMLDSLSLLKCPLFGGTSLIDVGTGAGFPALPLAIALPELKVTALDSTGKKVEFIEEAARELKLSNLIAVCARAEELSRNEKYRDIYDMAVSRAVARLNVLTELCMPFVKKGGTFLAIKSSESDREVSEGERSALLLGGEKPEITDLPLPAVEGAAEPMITRIVSVKKIKSTHPLYPRRYAKILKEPL